MLCVSAPCLLGSGSGASWTFMATDTESYITKFPPPTGVGGQKPVCVRERVCGSGGWGGGGVAGFLRDWGVCFLLASERVIGRADWAGYLTFRELEAGSK